MKKIAFIVILTVILAAVALGLCSCNNDDVTTLYVYNWGEYISDGSEGTLDVNAAFEEYYYQTYGERIKVNYSTYSSNESMYDKISSGTANYDVIIPSDYMIERLISEGLLAKLNYDNIPNYKYISDDFKGENVYYDPQNEYSIPYAYGIVGIIYNTKLVDADDPTIGSWGLMWNEKYTGSILQFNNSRDAFGTALYYLGYDVNDATEAQWQEALELLKKQKSVVQGYVMDEVFNKMISGSAAIASYYAGDFFTMYEGNSDLAFYYPKEGTNIYIDAMCIPATSNNQLIAERYIDFMLSEQPAIANAEYTCYASPNLLVTNNQEYIDYMAELHPDAMKILYSEDNDFETTFYKNLSREKLTMLNSLWEELKIESPIGNSIYIGCGILVAALAVVAVVFVVRKKKRERYDED
ncbi:MAG: spermidine/putrescine ABC transporter substrate-binding protein [Eubacteriales bacterium]|nr:spermidine/putrescine ABC transporter substrate-binding protein [Eubacteriales bacterium]